MRNRDGRKLKRLAQLVWMASSIGKDRGDRYLHIHLHIRPPYLHVLYLPGVAMNYKGHPAASTSGTREALLASMAEALGMVADRDVQGFSDTAATTSRASNYDTRRKLPHPAVRVVSRHKREVRCDNVGHGLLGNAVYPAQGAITSPSPIHKLGFRSCLDYS
jgi:hypothetical protein